MEKLNFSSKCTFHQPPSDTVRECRQSGEFVNRCNIVVRDVRDRNGNRLGTIVEPHDSTEDGIIAAAQRATDRMYEEFSEASNIQSCIGATDATGRPQWSVSPNFKYIAEIGTDEASYIWGNVRPQYSLKD